MLPPDTAGRARSTQAVWLRMPNVVNFCAFQLGWFACALGAAYGQPYLGPIVVTLLISGQLPLNRKPLGELRLILAIAVLGTVVDSLHRAMGVVEFRESLVLGVVCPLWMTALWANFAATLHHSLAWLDRRPLAAALLGAIGGPLSYLAGDRWGALSLGSEGHMSTKTSLLVLAVSWGLVTPLLFWLARKPFFGGQVNSPTA